MAAVFLHVTHPVTHTQLDIELDQDTLDMVQRKHPKECPTPAAACALLEGRTNKMLERISRRRIPSAFHETDIVVAELLIAEDLIDMNLSHRLVQAIQAWIHQKHKLDAELPFAQFAGAFEAILYTLRTKAEFEDFLNDDLMPTLTEAGIVPPFRTLVRRAVELADADDISNECDDYVDRRLLVIMGLVGEPPENMSAHKVTIKRRLGLLDKCLSTTDECSSPPPTSTAATCASSSKDGSQTCSVPASAADSASSTDAT